MIATQRTISGQPTVRHPTSPRFLVVGAGFSGAVIARELATNLQAKVLVIDQRTHLGGNCATERDADSDVMIHLYGPHIFNTDIERVWKYVNTFGEMRPFVNRVKAKTARGMFSLPINLLTLNQFFNKCLNPKEAQIFLATLGDKTIGSPANFEEAALKTIGPALYDAFFYGYTKKQWGCEPKEIPASVLRRLPIRFTYDDNYYECRYQGIPEKGYSSIVNQILRHDGIETKLNFTFDHSMIDEFDHVFFTGAIDHFFNYRLGRLGYRTVTFERIESASDIQGNAIINYTEEDVPFTRIHEHKYFEPWKGSRGSIAFREYSKNTEDSDIPYYPIRRDSDKTLLEEYVSFAQRVSNVSFLGRLGTYRYLDMDDVINEALIFSDRWQRAWTIGSREFPNCFAKKSLAE